MVRVWLSVNLKRHGVDCGRTVGRIGPATRADRSRMWPHLGHNLDTGGKPIERCARRAREKPLATELGFEGHVEWAESMHDGGRSAPLLIYPAHPFAGPNPFLSAWPTDDLHEPLARHRNRCSRGPGAVLEKCSAIAAAIS